MSREIKFRIWDKQLNKWYEPIYEAWRGELFEILIGVSGQINIRSTNSNGGMILEHESLPKYKDRFLLMQFTGLKENAYEDINKNSLIYEGDIIEFINGERLSVEWNDDTCQFQYSDGSPLNNGERYGTHKQIIGNIYENPELLK